MLLDSNIIIYAMKPEFSNLRDLIEKGHPKVSAISYLEVLAGAGSGLLYCRY
jgi:predicted nucleic acid-binding protein